MSIKKVFAPENSSPHRVIHSQRSFLIATALLFAFALLTPPTQTALCQGCLPGDFWGDYPHHCNGEYVVYTPILYHCDTDCQYMRWVGECPSGIMHRWQQEENCGSAPPPHTLSVSGALTCGATNGSWCTGWASLLISATDSYSGHVVTISPCGSNPCSVSLPEGSGDYGYSAACEDGLSATGSTYYALDLTPPIVSTWLTGGTPGVGGWYTAGPVTLNCSETDVPSGVPAGGGITYGTQTSGTADGSYSLSCTGYDVAGNSASAYATVNIDGTPPAITPTVSGGTMGGAGWYLNGPVSLTCSAADATSGVATVVYGTMTATAPGTTTLDCTAYDNAGNSSYYSVPITIDNIAPNAKFVFIGDYCTGGWYNSPVFASLLVSDGLSGVGQGIFQVDGEDWDSVKPIKDGIHSLSGTGWDLAGNAAQLSEILQVDTYAPMSSFLTESGSWVAGSVTLEGQSIDWTSGIKKVEISLDNGRTRISIGGSANWSYEWNTLDPDTPVPDGSYTVLARALDNACNQEHTGVVEINVDNTPPDLTLKDSINLMGRTTTVVAVDAGSGVDHGTVTITGNGIEPVIIPFASSTDVSWDGRGGDGGKAPFGVYDILVDVWDKVGNHSSARGTWIRPQPEQPTGIPPINDNTNGNNSSTDTVVDDGNKVELPPLGLPFWLIALPIGALGVWLSASSVALVSDRRWKEIRGIRNAFSQYRNLSQSNISEEGEK